MVTMTPTAAAKVAELVAGEDAGSFLRLAVRPGGCSGYSYELYFDATIAEDDLSVEVDGVVLVVDAVSAPLVEGATVEFSDGLSGAGFKVSNPSASRTCGCGQSFA